MFSKSVAVAFILSLTMSILSAWIRLDDSGIGCEPWPECYGVSVVIDKAPGITIAATDSNKGLRTAHRLMAGIFGILILGIATAAIWYRKRLETKLSWPILAVIITIVLSLVGMNTPDIQRPIITTTNLVGGMALTAILLHMYLEQRHRNHIFPLDARISAVSLGIMLLLVTSGAWVSANYAAGACGNSYFSCDLSVDTNLATAFEPTRELEIEDSDIAASMADRVILLVHQATGPIAAFVAIFCAILAIGVRGSFAWWMLGPPLSLSGIVVITLIEGVKHSVAAASLHNFFSLALLLSLVYHIHRQRREQ